MASLAECIPGQHRAPGLSPSTAESQAQCSAVILALGRQAGGLEIEGHLLQQSKFEAILGYMRPGLVGKGQIFESFEGTVRIK